MIGDVALQNFLLPAYFEPPVRGARTNFLGNDLDPFGIAADSYVGYYDPEKQSQETAHAEWPDRHHSNHMEPQMKPLKKAIASGLSPALLYVLASPILLIKAIARLREQLSTSVRAHFEFARQESSFTITERITCRFYFLKTLLRDFCSLASTNRPGDRIHPEPAGV